MTFSSAIRYLKNGQAAKVPSMAGYVYRTDFTKGEQDTWKEKYTISFKERADTDGDSVTLYPFVFTVDQDGRTTVQDPTGGMKLDGQLLMALASEDWTIGDQSAYEDARTGTGRRW